MHFIGESRGLRLVGKYYQKQVICSIFGSYPLLSGPNGEKYNSDEMQSLLSKLLDPSMQFTQNLRQQKHMTYS